MPLPPALTPEQRHAALQKAAEARRQRAEVKAKLKQGSLGLEDLFDQGTRDDALAKLKVVSVLESLPGVGKVQARRIMDRARHQREPSAPRSRPQPARGSARATRRSCAGPDLAVLLVIVGPSGVGKGTVVRKLLERDPSIWLSVSATTRAPAARRGRRRRLPLRQPGGVRGAAQRRRPPRGVRGLRPLVRHPAGARGGAPGRRAGRAAGDRRPGRAGGAGGRFPTHALLVFVRPPSREEQRRRLVERGEDDAAEIERRLAAAADRGGPRGTSSTPWW